MAIFEFCHYCMERKQYLITFKPKHKLRVLECLKHITSKSSGQHMYSASLGKLIYLAEVKISQL